MVGVVPFSCALNHGLFNVQPVFFEELAKANNYELIGLFYTIASESIYTWCPYPYSRKLLETLYAFIDYKLPSYGCEEQIGYIVKKTHDAEFQLPYQGTQVYHNKIGIDLEKTYENQNLGYLDSDYTMEDHIARYSSSRKARYHMFKRGDARSKLKMVANKFRHPGQILTLIKGKM